MIPYLRPDLVQHDLLHIFTATAPEHTETLTAGSLVPGEYVHGVARGTNSRGDYATTWEGTFVEFAPLGSRLTYLRKASPRDHLEPLVVRVLRVGQGLGPSERRGADGAREIRDTVRREMDRGMHLDYVRGSALFRRMSRDVEHLLAPGVL